MFRMEIDSPSSDELDPFSPQDFIIQRLKEEGVPREYLERLQSGLIAYYKKNRLKLPGLVSAILPTYDTDGAGAVHFQESMVWLQWLMFEKDPESELKNLFESSVDQRGVCGAVWGNNDIAYRCRTCEHDPTCAICVPCFQNGNHKDHDYSIIYTGGGCCDCGDVTAWKRGGFCSKHKGTEQIQPLSKELADSVRPVLDLLCSNWKYSLTVAENNWNHKADDRVEESKISDGLSKTVVEMLLELCNCSESLLSFISSRILSSVGLLDILVRAEMFLKDEDVMELQSLLLKLLSEPLFKYEFAKVFLNYYPEVIDRVIKKALEKKNDGDFKSYPLISTFSVQIFTVPTLTPRLVKERDLLVLLLECLKKIFVSCAGEDGRLDVNKSGIMYDTTLRVVEDFRFVMSHATVPNYVTNEKKEIVKMWMKILAFIQGMNPQKRETGAHLEDNTEYIHVPFILGHTVANIHSLLVAGEFSEIILDEKDEENFFNSYKNYSYGPRHAKVGKHSEEGSVSSKNNIFGSSSQVADINPKAVSYLTDECIKAIDIWLTADMSSETLPRTTKTAGNNSSANKKTPSKSRSSNPFFGSYYTSSNSSKSPSESEQDMAEDTGSGKTEEKTPEALSILSLSDWPNISYNVSSSNISVQIPLHRLLAMILHRAVKKCYGELNSPITVDMSSLDTPSDDFFCNIISGIHPHGFSACIMEHPLRIRVFCAQVLAGMWRKNGETALCCREWYRSVRWSEQGLELDLFLLQCCAALAPADLYVNRFLERFGLSNYLNLDVEQFNEFEPVLMQEMLVLFIQIVKERRFCGLTAPECLQRELICKLAIGSATHSQLVKSLPRDLSKVDQFQEILDKIATYSTPSGINQGMYKLRLEYWKQLDLYHPRWNSREMQITEERYLKFCGASALTSHLPKWTDTYEPFYGIAKIATCKVVLQIIRAVLFYFVYTNDSVPSLSPDSLLVTALHLLSLGIDICFHAREGRYLSVSVNNSFPILALAGEELSGNVSLLSLLVDSMRKNNKERPDNFSETGGFNISNLILNLLKRMAELDSGCMSKLQKLAPEVVSHLSHNYSGTNMGGMFSEADKRKAKARERQAAIMEKMRAQQSKFLESVNSTANNELDSPKIGEASPSNLKIGTEKSTQDVCSLCHDPSSKNVLCYFVLLQKSVLQSLVDRGAPSWKDVSGSDTEQFLEMSPPLDKSPSASSSKNISSFQFNQLIQSAIDKFASDGHPREINAFVEFIKSRFPSVRNILLPSTSSNACEMPVLSLETIEEDIYLAICEQMRDKSELDHDFVIVDESPKSEADESILLGKYIATLPKEKFDSEKLLKSAEVSESSKPVFSFGPVDCDGIHISSCGHVVHQVCLDRYLSSVKERYLRRAAFEGRYTADLEQGEFLCPVCRGLANSVLPALPRDSNEFFTKKPMDSTMGMLASSSCSTSENKELGNLLLREACSLLNSAADVVGRNEILKVFPTEQNERISPNLQSVFRILSDMYFPEKQEMALGSERVSHSVIMWDTLKYSLTSTEIASRCRRSSLSPNFSVDALFKELKSSKVFILSLLLKIVLGIRNKNSLSVLLRLRGIQLFGQSVCSGASVDDLARHSLEGGNMSSILEKLGREVPYPDIEFFRRASNPIISSDAFSSLMWVLFCLPSQFFSCEDSFLSLVHLFYGVSIAQAIITYFGKFKCNISELGYDGVVIAEIFNIMQERGVAKQYFISNHLDHPFDIKSIIRGLTFPYLRRCGLLWKIIKSSTFAPFSDGPQPWNSSSHDIDDMMEDVNNKIVEAAEFEALEKKFKIPSLEIVLNDEVLCSLVSRWVRHFNREFEVRCGQMVLPMTPAIPFKLMILPNVYHDLLQRYIKQHCPDCSNTMEEPSLCLLCGKLCSPNWKTCCSENDCLTHAMACGAGVGIFLLVRKTTILLLRASRQASWPSPYLDAYGEEDNEMHRGKPLYLNEERYAFLTYMVASHGFDRISKSFRQAPLGL